MFPFYSMRNDLRFDEFAEKLDAEQLTDVLTLKELTDGFRCSKSKSFLLFFDCNDRIVGYPYSSPGKSYAITRSDKIGNLLLWNQEAERRVVFDLATGEKKTDAEKFEKSMMLFLYYSKCTQDRMTRKSTSSYRVLWKLWDWERKDEDVTVDSFPFFTYDSKTNGYSKTSLLLRLFRNEYDPKTDSRSVDFLFIPVWR